jgi:hypothetical protein
MNRERAETYLRLLAEAEMRAALSPGAPRSADGPAISFPVKVARVAWVLTAAGALDRETAETVLADIRLALAAREFGRADPTTRVLQGTGVWAFVCPLTREADPAAAGAPDRHVPIGRGYSRSTPTTPAASLTSCRSRTPLAVRGSPPARGYRTAGPVTARWGLASGLALAVRPAGSQRSSGSTARRIRGR